MKICPKCLKNYKRLTSKIERNSTRSSNGNLWLPHIYHNEATRKCAKHHAQTLAESANRRARKSEANVAWASQSKIKQVYAESKRIEKCTGTKHHVDHIVPLRGKAVCGLHVEYNLQIIPASQNIRKGNKQL